MWQYFWPHTVYIIAMTTNCPGRLDAMCTAVYFVPGRFFVLKLAYVGFFLGLFHLFVCTAVDLVYYRISSLFYINGREYRRGNHKWIIQRNWQHSVHKTKKNKTKSQHNTC